MRPGGRTFASGNRSGQAGLFIVLNLTMVFGCLGLAVDVGWAYYTRQSAQTAADAAAMAAAAYASYAGAPACGSGGVICGATTNCAYPNVTPPVNDYQVGCLYAAANGFVNSGSQSVSLSGNTTAPPGVTGNTPSYWVQANITAKPYTLFGIFGGIQRFTINASAKAAVAYYTAGACIYAVGSGSIPDAFSVTGSATVTATCGIFVNSSNAAAYYEYGSPSVTATQILVNGGKSVSGSSSVSPTPTTGAGAQTDPLATLSMPTFSNVCPSPPYSAYVLNSTTVANVPSGNYCGGITISNSAKATFTGGNYYIYGGLTVQGSATASFGSGLYIVNGSSSGVAVDFANSAVVSGTAVTFFLTGQYGQTMGAVTSTGATTVNLSAPTSGSYQGMLFLQDRNLSTSTATSFANSASSVLQGTLYFPNTAVSYSGASSTGSYTALIAKTVSISGSATFKNDPTGTYTGLGTTVRGLIQ